MTQPTSVIPTRFTQPLLGLGASRFAWLESALEGAQLCTFMVSACVFTFVFEHPKCLASLITSAWLRRVFEGLFMGLTAALLIYSPMGKRSGAHMNPAVTLTFWRLGKVNGTTALAYVVAQFIGGYIGVALCAFVLGPNLAAPEVAYAVTVPGSLGATPAFLCEALISFVLMLCVLWSANHPRLHARTGFFASALIVLFIVFEAPYSGMSMNPARTLGSALAAQRFEHLWLYFVAPPLGMLLAAEVYVRLPAARRVLCAKFNHTGRAPCPFNCNFDSSH